MARGPEGTPTLKPGRHASALTSPSLRPGFSSVAALAAGEVAPNSEVLGPGTPSRPQDPQSGRILATPEALLSL